jgi:hypothetical protein
VQQGFKIVFFWTLVPDLETRITNHGVSDKTLVLYLTPALSSRRGRCSLLLEEKG